MSFRIYKLRNRTYLDSTTNKVVTKVERSYWVADTQKWGAIRVATKFHDMDAVERAVNEIQDLYPYTAIKTETVNSLSEVRLQKESN